MFFFGGFAAHKGHALCLAQRGAGSGDLEELDACGCEVLEYASDLRLPLGLGKALVKAL